MPSFLLIQTASIGDVILITPAIERLHFHFTDADIDLLVKKGNESLFDGHPFLRKVYVWDKSQRKYPNLLSLIRTIRKNKYVYIINFQRFASTGILTCLSGAKVKTGFDKNPFSFCYNHKIRHIIYPESNIHETERNLRLLDPICPQGDFKPKLYPASIDFAFTQPLKKVRYACVAPASLWFTKQLPAAQWVGLLNELARIPVVYLLGSASDMALCESIRKESNHPNVQNLAGKLNLLQSAALMQEAVMNWVNDSSPMHLASAVDAPVAAVFCSTVTNFGFGPLSSRSFVVESNEKLVCRPCGLHGHTSCPEQHFRCATSIKTSQLTYVLSHD